MTTSWLERRASSNLHGVVVDDPSPGFRLVAGVGKNGALMLAVWYRNGGLVEKKVIFTSEGQDVSVKVGDADAYRLMGTTEINGTIHLIASTHYLDTIIERCQEGYTLAHAAEQYCGPLDEPLVAASCHHMDGLIPVIETISNSEGWSSGHSARSILRDGDKYGYGELMTGHRDDSYSHMIPLIGNAAAVASMHWDIHKDKKNLCSALAVMAVSPQRGFELALSNAL